MKNWTIRTVHAFMYIRCIHQLQRKCMAISCNLEKSHISETMTKCIVSISIFDLKWFTHHGFILNGMMISFFQGYESSMSFYILGDNINQLTFVSREVIARTIDQRVVQGDPFTLQWRYNRRDGISNHQSHDCLLNHLFWRRSKLTSKLHVTGFYEGNSPVTGDRWISRTKGQ